MAPGPFDPGRPSTWTSSWRVLPGTGVDRRRYQEFPGIEVTAWRHLPGPVVVRPGYVEFPGTVVTGRPPMRAPTGPTRPGPTWIPTPPLGQGTLLPSVGPPRGGPPAYKPPWQPQRSVFSAPSDQAAAIAAQRRAQEAARKTLAEQARRREHSLQEQMRRSLERQEQFAAIQRRHLAEQQQLRARLAGPGPVTIGGEAYRRDPRTGMRLAPGQTPQMAWLQARGGDPTQALAFERAAQSAAKVSPFWQWAHRKTMGLVVGVIGGVAGMGQYGVDVGMGVDEIGRRATETDVRVDPRARDSTGMERLAQYVVTVKGIVQPVRMQALVTDIAREYAKALAKAEKDVPKKTRGRAGEVGRRAERALQQRMQAICQRHGLNPNRVTFEHPTGATGRRGGQIRYDVSVELPRSVAHIELKKSGYSAPRVSWQLQAQLVGAGEGAASGRKPASFFLVHGEEGRVLQWTAADARRAVAGGRPFPGSRGRQWRIRR